MTSNSPEIQLRNLTEWFAAKANNEEPFSTEGAAHFLSSMRSVTADVRALRVLADAYLAKSHEVTTLALKCALLELEVRELREKPLMSINLADAVIIPITEGGAAS
jgi:hypothetical protein